MRYFMPLVIVLLTVACAQKKEPGVADGQSAETTSLAPEQFKAKLESTPDAVLVDVRTPDEVSEGVIAGARVIDFKDPAFEQQISALEKNKTYFVYCASGGRSGKTATLLKEKGFQNVYSLEGGMNAWKEKGLPTEIRK